MTSVQTILHPTDFSPCAESAFQAACALARDRGAQVVLLHVLEPVRLPTGWRFNPTRRERWEALRVMRSREPDVWIEPVLRKGAAVPVILGLAREIQCDLIVMGLHGQTERGQSVPGGVAGEVSRLAPCPVLGVTLPRRGGRQSSILTRRVEVSGVDLSVSPPAVGVAEKGGWT